MIYGKEHVRGKPFATHRLSSFTLEASGFQKMIVGRRGSQMHQQLQAIAEELETAQAHLHRLAGAFGVEQWSARPNPRRWSPAECIAHLNLTAVAFRDPVERALEEGRRRAAPAPPRYRRDPLGWLLWRIMAPPVRFKVKTAPAFIPAASRPLGELLAEFDRLQGEQLGWVRAADGLALGQLWVRSPFSARAKYNLYACLSILPRHQERHLWQAEQALQGRLSA
jgi:hypothetical protein